MQIQAALQQARRALEPSSDSARLDAELLLAKVLAKPRSYLFAWPERELQPTEYLAFQNLVAQRLQGQPVAYLLGYREFWGMELEVSPATLIPRSDTELIVELVLAQLAHQPAPNILDLGTGTGAIALALAKERPDARILAIDNSVAALAVAQRNQQRLGFSQLSWLAANWLSALAPVKQFDLIVSNPPYIAEDDPHLLQGDLRFEPRSALSSGIHGLDDLRHLIQTAPHYLQVGGWLVLEHGYTQASQVAAAFKTANYTELACYQDLAGHDRVSLGRCPN